MLSTTLSLLSLFAASALASPLEEKRTTCNRDNVLRCLVSASPIATPYCSSYLNIGVVTSYTSTITPTAFASATITTTLTSLPLPTGDSPEKRGLDHIDYTIYAGSPAATVVGPDFTTTVLLNRRGFVEPRATVAPKPAPICLAQYSAPPARLTSACRCLGVPSSTLKTVSTASPTTVTVTATATATVAPPPPPPACDTCTRCSSDADCGAGNVCVGYIGFSFSPANLCTRVDFSNVCGAVCE
ncbi:MAG: hypothetical protein Q9219_007501 [cf. Caloplaca sp. 3 TL-2023]